ncbi:hypothetical protein ACNF40_01105 [Cuniculiplasma sp. SKW4]|uniref:hypothetical protein n=1 Tax=Cuniculiplasma sp. SKW4 TaxID=3400171 RepID=UPI003FD4EA59
MNESNLNTEKHENQEEAIIKVTLRCEMARRKKSYAIIDGMNIAMIRKRHQRGKFSDIMKAYNMLLETYSAVEIYVDASIMYRIDDKSNLEKAIKDEIVYLCPAGITADELIWKRSLSLISAGYEVAIVTNDMFPVTRYEPTLHKLKNLTVSILRSGEVYIIERNLNVLYNKPHRKQNVHILSE